MYDSETFHFMGGYDHCQRLAEAYFMIDKGAPVLDNAPGSVLLRIIEIGDAESGAVKAGESQVLAIVFTKHIAVEGLVVNVLQRFLFVGRKIIQPVGKTLADGFNLLVGELCRFIIGTAACAPVC